MAISIAWGHAVAVALETAVKQLEEGGIVAPGKLENFIPPKAHPKSVEELVRALVKENHLTRFQAQQVAAGRARALLLGGYTILDKIGAGGMGQVFKAEHRRMKRIVAIKMLPASTMRDAAAVARFGREVEAAARLEHPNIVAAHDADEANGAHFLVMQYVEGSDLSALVKKDGPLPVGKAVNCIPQASRGLEFAHKKGVIHRDIKPANLLLDNEGTVKILDMGLARIESDGNAATQAELTGTGAVMGTVDYMAPEQALNTKYADARADIYSLGCSLYYLLSGRAAYAGDTVMEKLLAHREQSIPSLQDVQASIPKQLEAVFRKMVSKKAKDRYQSMGEVVEALEALGFGGSGTSGTGEGAKAWTLSAEERKRLRKPSGSLAKAVISHPSTHLVAKIVGGAFATIIAPILVTYLIECLKKDNPPSNPPATAVPAATVSPVAVASGATPALLPPGEGGRRPDEGAKPWNTPDFRAWMKTVSTLPAEKQVEAVSKKLMELNPGFDGKVTDNDGTSSPQIENGVITELGFVSDTVTDISPVRALVGLEELKCRGSGKGNGKLSDLSPLEGMKLMHLSCGDTQVSDLSPLQGMPLNRLTCSHTLVSDLSPLRTCTSLISLGIARTKVTPAGVAALQKALPHCKIEWDDPASLAPGDSPGAKARNTPAFQAWMKTVAALPAEKQVEAVSKKLMELNPGFDGKVSDYDGQDTPRINKGVLTELKFDTDNVTDISPVRALTGLTAFSCSGSSRGQGKLSDLSPLTGMPLTSLNCGRTRVSDLSPLQGMPLRYVDCRYTQVSDLSPLEDCKSLKSLRVTNGNVTPAAVAALQKALPNCKIEWDDPAGR